VGQHIDMALLDVGNDGQFVRFASNALRVQNRAVLVPLIQSATRSRSTADWIARLKPLALPCGPINDIGQTFAQTQVAASNLVVNQPVD
jgi:crotonobetainyl-CoA:carnitine CoA-transferase CaiB-like acyl-CoA transferase